MKLYHASDFYTIYHGDAVEWGGAEAIDLVLTNPYDFLPPALRGTPMILHQWRHRQADVERWAGLLPGQLQLIGSWNDDRECFWAANMPDLDGKTVAAIARFRPEPGGWYPLALPLILLERFAQRGMTIFDGFMGRGTVGLAAYLRGCRFVGVEQLEAHLALARDFLTLDLIDGTA